MFLYVLLFLNGLLLWGFGAALFGRHDYGIKVAGFVFGVIAVCNLINVLSQLGWL
jgi:hypothetical protein